MHPFEQTVSVVVPIVGAIVAAIVVLTLFFKLLNWGRRGAAFETTRFAVTGVFDGKTPSTVHLSNGSTIEDVRILGFTDSSSAKTAFPYELGHTMVLRHPDGRHTLVQAKTIRRIEVPAQTS